MGPKRTIVNNKPASTGSIVHGEGIKETVFKPIALGSDPLDAKVKKSGRYKCPRCFGPFCSLECQKVHKEVRKVVEPRLVMMPFAGWDGQLLCRVFLNMLGQQPPSFFSLLPLASI